MPMAACSASSLSACCTTTCKPENCGLLPIFPFAGSTSEISLVVDSDSSDQPGDPAADTGVVPQPDPATGYAATLSEAGDGLVDDRGAMAFG
jgi:hypothetical protein